MKEQLSKFGHLDESVSLKPYNTFHIGGTCRYMIFPKSMEQVKDLLVFLKEKEVKYFILGNGSNIIFSDDFYDGVVISLKEFQTLSISGDCVTVGAGVMMPVFAMKTIRSSLEGMEWAVGIPGTVGGCIYGNAGAYKESTFDYLEEVVVLTPNQVLQVMKKEELSYGYRTSFFKENSGYVILEAKFRLRVGNMEESLEKVSQRKEKRMLTQPLDYPNAGSVFRNPSIENPSGKLIEDLGLKGRKIGDAMVSMKHANFIINTGHATSNDVRNLIELVHSEVLKHYGIDLVMEQEYVGWD